MKRFWLVLLALGLVMAFSASVFAADVKFSGSYYVAGVYQDKTSLIKDGSGPSTAFYYQRLRIMTEFIASPALKLVTRFDAMERVWGAPRATGNLGNGLAASDMNSSATTFENENIAFDLVYVQYASKIGLFRVGYQDDGAWGTVFGDTTMPLAKITYILPIGPFTAIAYIGKFKDASFTAKVASPYADADVEMYVLAGNYAFKTGSVAGSAGVLYKFIHNNNIRPSFSADQQLHFLLPYAKVQIGPVAVQAELIYGFGKYINNDVSGVDVDLDNLAGWVDATADFGMFYFGGSLAYISGDDPLTADKKEGNVITGGADWNPCLIMFNFDRYYTAGQLPGNSNTLNPNNNDTILAAGGNDGGMSNAWFGQLRVGVRPVAELDIMASLSYAQAVEHYAYGNFPGDYLAGTIFPVTDHDYGWEVDVTATYKITNNLSYMLGGGYLFTGDYFKGDTISSPLNDVQDNFLIINKLTLTF